MNRTWSAVALATATLALSAPSSVADDRNPTGTGELFASTAVTGRDIAIVPSAPEIRNCFPFANNTSSGFAGFIYRNVPAFQLRVGDAIAFDLGALNHRRVRRDVYLASANKNPGPAEGVGNTVSQGVRAMKWIKVVAESQVPTSPFGDTTVGNFELTYRAESGFRFAGGGLVVGFAPSPPALVADKGCEQVGVSTDNMDPSGRFYARFCLKPFLTRAVIDTNGGCNLNGEALQGIMIHSSGRPPV